MRSTSPCSWAALPALSGLFQTATCVLLSVAVYASGVALAQAQTLNEEDSLIQVLKSDQSLQKKDEACARLKRIGTDKCIPALSSLLLDENLSHSARYALEPMSSPKAEQALLTALSTAKHSIRLGIISSLGVRRDVKAVPDLARLLKDSDASTASAAATALGQIGGMEALDALVASWRQSKTTAHGPLTDGILRCANGLLGSGKESKALNVFKQLYNSSQADPSIRVAAYSGMVRASGSSALKLETSGLTGSDPAARLAALKLGTELELPGTTKALTGVLPRLQPRDQAALIGVLQQRNDRSAVPPIVALAQSASPEVRLASVRALGDLGDDHHVDLLAALTTSAASEEQRIAGRKALVDLRGGNVTEALVKSLQTSEPAKADELARALGERGDRAAVPGLMQLARGAKSNSQKPVLRALATLARESELPAMIELVVSAKDAEARSQAAEALNTAFQQCLAAKGRVPIEPLVSHLKTGTADTRMALLPVCSGLSFPEIRSVLEAAIQDQNPSVRVAGIRALCDTLDIKLLPTVLELARTTADENFKTLATAACVRLTTSDEGARLPNAERVQTFHVLMQTPLNAAQKRQVLSGLAEIPDLAAFRLAEQMLGEAGIQAEAAQALVKIAGRLSGAESRETLLTLQTIVGSTATESVRKTAAQTIKQIETNADYITAWQVTGPYLQTGKDFSALFDIVFPPENPDSAVISWKKLEPSGSGEHPWVMDLLKAIGGDQRVAYARTWVHSDEERPVRLELGTDDGVKVWLNHKLVYSNNTARPLQVGSDKADVTLVKGWNELLLKVTQNNLAWEFCARLLQPDGSHVAGLKTSLEPVAQ